MTVKDLIAKLRGYDPDMPVAVNNGVFDETLEKMGVISLALVEGELIPDKGGRKHLYLGSDILIEGEVVE